jgi:hypothetical protein
MQCSHRSGVVHRVPARGRCASRLLAALLVLTLQGLGNGRSGLGNVVHVDVAVPLDGGSSIRNVQFLVESKRSF